MEALSFQGDRVRMLSALITALLEEDRKYETFSDFLHENPGIPGFVATGDGRSLYFSRAAEGLIREIARHLKREDSAQLVSHTDDEWRQLVRRLLGPAITNTQETEDIETDAKLVLAKLRLELTRGHVAHKSSISFGANIFSDGEMPAFDVGPVRIEPREEWLTRQLDLGHVSETTKRRISKIWSGSALRSRRSSIDSICERDVLDSVGDCHYVCSVATGGLANDSARKKAIIAARLVLLVTCLTWEHPSAALRGIRLSVDAESPRQTFLRIYDGRRCFAERRRGGLPHAPYVDRTRWQKIFEQQEPLRRAAGDVIGAYLSTNKEPVSADVLTALFHAMLWFYGKRQGDPV